MSSDEASDSRTPLGLARGDGAGAGGGGGGGTAARGRGTAAGPAARAAARARAPLRRLLEFGSSLRGRQVLLVAGAILLVILIALSINFEAGRRDVEQAKEQSLRLARFVAQEQRNLLESTRRLLAAFAELPAVAAGDRTICGPLFAHLIEGDPIYHNFAVVDVGGAIVCAAADRPPAVNAVGRSWFERVKETGAFAVGDYLVGRASGRPVLIAAAPVKDERGRLQRIVVAALSIAWLAELLQDLTLPSDTTVSVTDGRGVVLARLPAGEALVGEPLPVAAEVRELVLTAPAGAVERPGPAGEPYLYGFASVPDTNVRVLVERSRASALAEVYQLTERLLLSLVLAEILILVAVFAAGRIFLLRPVEALAGAAGRLAAGDLTARSGLRPYRDDELGRLARVFDDMAERLQGRQEALEDRRARAEARFMDAIETVPHAFILWDADDRLVLWNRRYLEFFPALAPHVRPGVPFAELVRHSAMAGHFAGTKGHEPEWVAARLERRRRLGQPFEWRLADGRWVEVREYRTAENGVLAIFTDVTERRAAEAALRESRERLRAALAASGTGTWRWDFATHVVDADADLARLFGLPPEPVRRDVRELGRTLHPDDREPMAAAGRRCVRHGDDFDIEFRVIWPDGSEHWLAGKGRTFRDGDGVPRYMTGACVDITRYKRLERQQRLLLAELSHRVKNTLATVQALAAQTLGHTESPAAFAETLTGRLGALADVHSLLTQGGWESAGLRAVVEQALRPYRGDEGRNVDLDGPELILTPKACLALSLVLHELTTNAVKYGALSVPEGRVEVRWRLERPAAAADGGDEGPRLRLTWRESGGPGVGTPARRGFGTRLIEHSIAYELDGDARLSYRPEGIACEIVVPWTDEVGRATGPEAGGRGPDGTA